VLVAGINHLQTVTGGAIDASSGVALNGTGASSGHESRESPPAELVCPAKEILYKRTNPQRLYFEQSLTEIPPGRVGRES